MSVAAILGAGPGIGAACARRFEKAGFDVAALARSPEKVHTGHPFPCDCERASSIDDALSRVERELGAIDVLIYNAATVRPGSPLEVGAEQLVRELRVDVVGLLVATQHVVPHMSAQGHGTILVTGGGLALDPWPKMTALAIGKAAVRSLALSLHKELAPQGIHAATVTVAGIVGSAAGAGGNTGGGRFDPDAIADVFWELHEQPRGSFEAERVIR